jgi:hypothetical protein
LRFHVEPEIRDDRRRAQVTSLMIFSTTVRELVIEGDETLRRIRAMSTCWSAQSPRSTPASSDRP